MEQRNKLQSERLDFLLDALKEDSIQYKNLQVFRNGKKKRSEISDECPYAAEYFG